MRRLPDWEDDPKDLLLSFPDIKAKTTETLYGHGTDDNALLLQRDKSPKGSVDEPIRHLVDLINEHPSFSTLSSCSGRISLFQPWGGTPPMAATGSTLEEEEEHPNFQDQNADSKKSTPESGKGRGGWLLVSHEKIEHSDLLKVFHSNQHSQSITEERNNHDGAADDDSSQVLMFKMEPMLLHVAAATLQRGRQLLAMALEMGFRESGLVVTDHRVTVAIRGMSLALTVPLALHGTLKPSDDYLRALVDQANQRMERNQTKLQRLFERLAEGLFRSKETCCCFQWQCHQSLADLNLWGHDAVVVPKSASDQPTDCEPDVDVLVIGGYGQGPITGLTEDTTVKSKGKQRQCGRVGNIYCLKQRWGQWESHWNTIQSTIQSAATLQQTIRMTTLGIDVQKTNYTPREGASVFTMQSLDDDSATGIVGIWGGRKGPHQALDEFLLYDHGDSKAFFQPMDVRGELPSARWGHTLTNLNFPHSAAADHGVVRLALLVGGRNERVPLNTAHVLSLVPSPDMPERPGHFLWETIDFDNNHGPRRLPFHHTTSLIPHDKDSVAVFVFGGLLDPCNLLESFASQELDQSNSNDSDNHFLTCFTLSLRDPCQARQQVVNTSSIFDYDCGVGLVATQLTGLAAGAENKHHFILLSGGVMGNDTRQCQDSCDALRLLKVTRIDSEKATHSDWRLQSARLISIHDEQGKFCEGCLEGSLLVHHRAVCVRANSKQAEILLLGGGLMQFAFGPCFSRCHRLCIRAVTATREGGSRIIKGNRKTPTEVSLTANGNAGSKGRVPISTNVLYVRKHNAKLLKTELEHLGLLDKRYRMTPVTEDNESGREIVVPITDQCLDQLGVRGDASWSGVQSQGNWLALVEGVGKQAMPLSTSQFAKKKK